MADFPNATWDPTAEEYFAATAPDGSRLHGSSTIRSFNASPRLFGEEMEAQAALDALRLWQAVKVASQRAVVARQDGNQVPAPLMAVVESTRPVLSPRHARTLKGMIPTAVMDFGTAVEFYTFPLSGEPKPELSKTVLEEAKWRADDIRRHPVAGAFTRAPGAAYQVAHRWQDPDSGLWLRMRLDCAYWSNDRPCDQDLKVWGRVTAKNIDFKIRDGGALLQEAIYRRGKHKLWGITTPKTLVIAGPKQHHKIFTVELSESDILRADAELSFTLERLAKAYETNCFLDPEEAFRAAKKEN